ncbi:hypothetical protein BBJ28_00024134 [Nothophytophthora sp. Chile5]|nr:hypothetical protein BBJ28_00024134 [Nothophytophthora sp. Chile5]
MTNDEVNRTVETLKKTIMDRIRSLMLAAVPDADDDLSTMRETVPSVVYSEDIMDFFEGNGPDNVAVPRDVRAGRVDEEHDCWIADPAIMMRGEDNDSESILSCWCRQDNCTSYHFLPAAARILFSIPTSSAQIERDFGVSGMMVTSQRASISAQNIDMCSFLNRSREFIDVTQCPRLQGEAYKASIPSNVLVPLEEQNDLSITAEWETVMANCFSENLEDDAEA